MSAADDYRGTPERLGGSPRTNADDAFATFMGMPEREWLGLIASLIGSKTPPLIEQQGFERALEARAKRGTLG